VSGLDIASTVVLWTCVPRRSEQMPTNAWLSSQSPRGPHRWRGFTPDPCIFTPLPYIKASAPLSMARTAHPATSLPPARPKFGRRSTLFARLTLLLLFFLWVIFSMVLMLNLLVAQVPDSQAQQPSPATDLRRLSACCAVLTLRMPSLPRCLL
jgi:hypothetical protein